MGSVELLQSSLRVTPGIRYCDSAGELQASHHWTGPFPCPTTSHLPGPEAQNRDIAFLELLSESPFMALTQEGER